VLPDVLLSVLACPTSKQPLIYFPRGEADTEESAGFLVCPASRLRYRIDRGVPVMLAEEAVAMTESEVAALVTRARELNLAVPTT